MILTLYILSGLYAGLILTLFIGIFLLKKPGEVRHQKISVIIAARNEEKHLPELLHRLATQNYPEDCFEIIVANDRSTDNTEKILSEYSSRIANLTYVSVQDESVDLVGKKGGLTLAIATASYPILAFTDADCLPCENWLKEVDKHFYDDVDFVAGYSPLLNNTRIGKLKNLERSSMFAVAAGSFGIHWPLTCTARNMAYRKDLYNAVEGYKGIGHIRSGDDDLMLQKMGTNIRKFNFMFSKEAEIPSFDKEDLQSQMQLESRRGSKWKYYSPSIKLIILVILSFYISIIFTLVATILGKLALPILGVIIFAKILPELLLIFTFLYKVGNKKLIMFLPIAELVYIPYFIFFGLKGTFGKYRWKN